MTRFAREWNGELGAFWQKNAHEEAARLLAQRDNIEVEEDGAAKWRSNGSYLPADVVEKLSFAGADFFSAEATAAKREAQTAEFLGSYDSRIPRKLPPEPQNHDRGTGGDGSGLREGHHGG